MVNNHRNINNPLRLIIVAGLTSSGKSTIAQAIADYLKWPLLSVGNISRAYCQHHNIDFPTTPDLNFHTELEKIISSIILNQKHHTKYLKINTNNQQLVLISRTAVYHAYNLKKQNPHLASQIFSILITAPEHDRIQWLSKRENISIKMAKQNLQKRDTNDLTVFRQLLHTNPLDPAYFDLVIDNTNITQDQLIKTVINKII